LVSSFAILLGVDVRSSSVSLPWESMLKLLSSWFRLVLVNNDVSVFSSFSFWWHEVHARYGFLQTKNTRRKWTS
jgi:hypothetical protein